MEYRAFQRAVAAAAEAAGLTEYELYYAGSHSQALNAFQGQIDGFTLEDTLGVCFRCIVDGKAGYASTELMTEQEAALLVENARQSALYVESDEPETLVHTALSFPAAPVPPEADTEAEIAAILAVEKKALSADPRITTTGYCRLMSGISEKGIFNSHGVDVSDRSEYYGWYVVPVAVENGKTVNAMAFQIEKDFSSLDADRLVAEAVENTLATLGAERPVSGQYKTVLDSYVVGDFLTTFADVFSAEAAQKGLSLLAGREGERIASEMVTLTDDPLYPGAVFRSRFDDEGVACKAKNLVEGGVLKTLLYNLKTAAKAGRETTGNAYKSGYSARVTVAPTNLFLQPSDTPLEGLFAAVGDGLYVTEVTGTHAGADAVSGDFSLEAKGFRIADGKKAGPVELFTIAGNFFTLLQDIERVGSDLKFGFPSGAGQIGAPSVVVRSLSVAGE